VAQQPTATQKLAPKEYADTEEAELIRIKAAEDEKKQPAVKPPAAEPVKKSEEAVPLAAQGLRIPLGKNCDTKKDV
jgi:hypothetical protein